MIGDMEICHLLLKLYNNEKASESLSLRQTARPEEEAGGEVGAYPRTACEGIESESNAKLCSTLSIRNRVQFDRSAVEFLARNEISVLLC